VIHVRRAGLLTTVQDTGRRGMQQHGVVTAGAMDPIAHRVANLLVGNPADCASLECTIIGPWLEFRDDVAVAVTGGDFAATLNDQPTPPWCAFPVRRGDVLALGTARTGCRAYIACSGGIDVPRVLGSRSTDLIAHMGGKDGRALLRDDVLECREPDRHASRIRDLLLESPSHARAAGRSLRPPYGPEPVVRMVRGPEHDAFNAASRDRLVTAAFQVTPQSNRMGVRLRGPALALDRAYDMLSSPVAGGTIQVPPSGEPVVLMADHQTIGGYPRIGNVISTDVPLLAQVPPGALVRFREVSIEEAQSQYLSIERDLRTFAEALRLRYQ